MNKANPSQNKKRSNTTHKADTQLLHILFCPSHNSGYMVPLRSTQIFAPLRSAKTSYSRERWAHAEKNPTFTSSSN